MAQVNLLSESPEIACWCRKEKWREPRDKWTRADEG